MGVPSPASTTSPSVRTYYLYKATKAVEFYRPIMYLFLLAQGLSFTQVVVLEAIYNVTTVLGEVPTGLVGDRVGRRTSLLLGTGLITVTLVGIGLAESFLALVGWYVLWSMGYNFRSGSEDAWLYDTLADERSTTRFAHVRGRGESVALGLGVLAAVIGGYLGGIDLSLPWFVAAAVTGLGVPVLLTVEEPATYQRSVSAGVGLRRMLGIVREVVARRHIRALVLYYFVLYAGVTYLVFIYLQPVFETVVVDLGVSPDRVESLLGLFYAAYSLVGAVLSYYTGAIQARVGVRTWFLVLPFAVGFALVGLALLPVLALPTFLVARGLADVTRTFASQYLNDSIDSMGRATVLSAMAMVSGLTVIPFQLASGVVSDAVSPLVALALAGGVLVVGSGLILLWEVPIARAGAAG